MERTLDNATAIRTGSDRICCRLDVPIQSEGKSPVTHFAGNKRTVSAMSCCASDGDDGTSSGDFPANSIRLPEAQGVMLVRSVLYNDIACSLQHLGAR
jgi:hypothetical protein